MTVSIVIPALNEETTLPALIPHLLGGGVEVLIVDGGSTDSTREIARQFPVRVLTAQRGRAVQMNAGAAAATGDWLWFLHADTKVPPDWREQLFKAMEDPKLVGGAFRVVIDAPGLRYRILDVWGRCRPFLQRNFFGDQGIFVRRDLFGILGGFPTHATLEDVDFSSRLWRLGKVVLLLGPLCTSARRWENAGWWRTVLTHCRLALTQPVDIQSAARRIALVIMAKAPLLGQVKTRLIPALGPQGARDLAQKLLEETGALVGEVEGVARIVSVSPATHLEMVRSMVPSSFRLIPQTEGDLGDRLAHLFRQLFAEGFDGVIALGADHPGLPKAYLEQAVAVLRAQTTQVVLGPTEDGGYYLIGLSQLFPELFQDIPWGGAKVLEATLQRTDPLGLSVHLLPPWFDLDRPEDLVRMLHTATPGT
ncbi:MAG: TIGR04283 family arsenosugar biosynthesis glycosyltransferase [Candidatus Omnitrophica bacterium]|nr:TIGR04283 family arsenosugar biosynthesis glycosyltransferase [Candidatus Omnitrophota bacterium]